MRERLVKLTELEMFEENRAFKKILLYGIAFGFIHRKKNGGKIKIYSNKSPLYLLPTIFSLTEA